MPNLNHRNRLICLLQSQFSSSILGHFVARPVDAAIDDEKLWLRFQADNERLRELELMLPGRRYHLLSDGWLVQDGHRVASARLPELKWQLLDTLIEWQLPIASFSGTIGDREREHIELTRGGTQREPSAAICQLSDLANWIETAPTIRTSGVSYCVSADECLLVGSPLPPIACRFLCDYEGVLIPAGMTWAPTVPPKTLRELFGVACDETLLWLTQDDWSLVDHTLLQPLRRASVRQLARQEAV